MREGSDGGGEPPLRANGSRHERDFDKFSSSFGRKGLGVAQGRCVLGDKLDVATNESIVDSIKFERNPEGLAPAVVQDASTKEVIMIGFMNRDALAKTLDTGHVTFWTRSRQKLWTKGETSGNVLNFVALRVNCNDDSLLVLANPIGPTCHTGHPTCYYREAEGAEWRTITEQSQTHRKRYTAKRAHSTTVTPEGLLTNTSKMRGRLPSLPAHWGTVLSPPGGTGSRECGEGVRAALTVRVGRTSGIDR